MQRSWNREYERQVLTGCSQETFSRISHSAVILYTGARQMRWVKRWYPGHEEVPEEHWGMQHAAHTRVD